MLFSINSKSQFPNPKDREIFAGLLSRLFVNPSNFTPYKPNEGDDYFWVLDAANDWKLTFFENYPDRFRITYRYQCEGNRYEEGLAEWLKIKYKVTVLAKAQITLQHITERSKRLSQFKYPMLWISGDVPQNFSISFGPSEPQGSFVAAGVNSSIHYSSETFLKAEATLSLFFPRIPGYRIVEIEEYENLNALPKNDESVEIFDGRLWGPVPTLHLDYSQIYQTKRPPENIL